MRICIYTGTALPLLGGQELVVDALARQFQQAGHESVVLAPRSTRGGPDRDAELPYRVERHPRFISKRYLVGAYAWWLRSLYRRWPFDVLHCHGIYQPAYVAAVARRHFSCPLLVTSHGEDAPAASHRLATRRLRQRHALALEACDALISISHSTRAAYLDLCPSAAAKIVEIPNGVDVQQYERQAARPTGLGHGVQPGQYRLFLGRLVQCKGVDVLLQAIAHLATDPGGDHLPLVIAGDGPQRVPLQALARQLAVDQRVHFVGAVNGEMKRYLLQCAQVLVCPSLWEGMPLVILEAFAAGTPVIGSDIPGISDLVRHERTGLTPPAGCPRALAAALRRAALDADSRQAWAAECRRVALDLDWSSIAARHLELYEHCREPSRPAAPRPVAFFARHRRAAGIDSTPAAG